MPFKITFTKPHAEPVLWYVTLPCTIFTIDSVLASFPFYQAALDKGYTFTSYEVL